MREFAQAEAIFGSAGRGDGDTLSDRDILIVDSDVRLLRRRQELLEKEGWSVASYTFAKLAALSSVGALFMQHLKTEGKILRDDKRQLSTLLSQFEPKASYGVELCENARLADLMAFQPDTRIGSLWAADVLYVAVRNYGILTLAQKRRYLFSYARVLEALAEERLISAEALPSLLLLRRAKSTYRSGNHSSADANTSIAERCLACLPGGDFPRQSLAMNSSLLLQRSAALPAGSSAYRRLRNLERTYIALVATRPSAANLNNLKMLARWIKNPRAYVSLAVSSERNLIAYMHSWMGENLASFDVVGQEPIRIAS